MLVADLLANPGRRDVVERATLSRDLLAPMAAELSGGQDFGLGCRCVLVRNLGFFRRPCHVRAAMAVFGDVEAVAVCRDMHNAVVVFRDEASVAVALRSQYSTPTRAGQFGLYSTVPPLYLGFPSCFIQPGLVEFSVYPPSAPTSREGSTSTTAAEPRERSWSWTWALGPPGTAEFVPFLSSKLQGPRLGEDGHLWVDGFKFTYYENGMQIDNASTRVVQVPSSLQIKNPMVF
ncbi:unnamed protein product [Urochloa humidicola]